MRTKRQTSILTLGMALALAGAARADFNPIPLTPGSFTADVIVEKTAPKPLADYVTATMDGGTNNNAWTYYEQGFDAFRPSTGVPVAGTTFAAPNDPGRQFKMPPTYLTNNAVLVYSAIPSGTLTLATPTPLNAVAVMCAVAGGDTTINYTVRHSGGADETGTLLVRDWFSGQPTVAYVANGRVSMDNGQIGDTFSGNPKLMYTDISIVDQVNPVTSIVFSSTSGNRVAIFGLSGSTDAVNFTPLTVSGFNRDMVIENTVTLTGSLFSKCTVTMDSGSTNRTGNTFYERGFNRGALTTGVPVAGSSISGGSPLHTFTMASDYTVNNVLYVGNYEFLNGDVPGENTLTLTTPTVLTGLSLLATAGNGPCGVTVTVIHADASTETFPISILNWFDGANPFYTLNGRFDPSNLALNNVNSGNPRLYTNDIVLASSSPVTSVQFTWTSGGRAAVLAIAGQTASGGVFSALPVTGYNADAIVEASAARFPNPLYSATTVSMDGGTNNTGNTWMEKGYYAAMPNSGLPAPGTIISSLTQPDHHYQMPASYTANNAVFVDSVHAEANLTLASPASYSALSFLSATANNNVTNEVVIQYLDGTQETNTFVSRDWFNNTPYGFTSLGRVSLDTRTINNDPGHTTTPNPRLYEAQFALGNTVSPVTNIVLRFLGAINPTTGRMVVLAVSATAGAVQPIISTISPQTYPTVMEGTNLSFSATVTGGTAPITYRWQVGTNGVWVDLVDNAKFSGVTTTNLTITSVGWTNVADYRMVATNIAGFGVSPIGTITRVLSGLPDVTQPGDPIAVYQPNGGEAPPGAEGADKAIDNTTSKYLNRGSGTTPFTGPGGFFVAPPRAGTIVKALRFYTANDTEGRDPANYLLEGSRDGGQTFATISSGALALPAGRNAAALALDPFTQNLQEVQIANTAGYTSYRLSFSAVKGNEPLMQIGEVDLLGVPDPNSVVTLIKAPADVSANEGSTAQFSVVVVGPGTYTYQWYNVTAGDPGTLVPGQTTATLSVPNVTASMNGNRYRVVVNNGFGAVTAPSTAVSGALLTVVSGPPAVQTDLASEGVVYVGRTAILPVGIGGTEPFTLQWQKDAVNLSDTARITGTHSNVLSIANANTNDAGSYQLSTIHNAQGDTQSAIQNLIVQTFPAFTGSGAGWALNGLQGTTPSPATMNGGVLELTLGSGNTARSAWYKFPLYIGGFKASFIYQDVTAGGADGMAFAIHNATNGMAALGGGGGGLGFSGITPSAALQFNIYQTAGIAFNTNGNTGGYSASGAVNVASGEPIKTEVSYQDGVMQVTLSNTVTAATFTTNMVVGSIPAVLGTNVAWVGFTGADGGTSSQQYVSEFKFIPVPTISARASGSAVIVSWPASVGGYKLVTSPSITSPVWTDAGLTETLVGNEFQVTIPAPTGTVYYRVVIAVP